MSDNNVIRQAIEAMSPEERLEEFIKMGRMDIGKTLEFYVPGEGQEQIGPQYLPLYFGRLILDGGFEKLMELNLNDDGIREFLIITLEYLEKLKNVTEDPSNKDIENGTKVNLIKADIPLWQENRLKSFETKGL